MNTPLGIALAYRAMNSRQDRCQYNSRQWCLALRRMTGLMRVILNFTPGQMDEYYRLSTGIGQ